MVFSRTRRAIGIGAIMMVMAAADAVPARIPLKPERMEPAPGTFLVASRSLRETGFAQTVVLLLRHDQGGSIGVVVNRPTRLNLAELFPEMPRRQARRHPVSVGGPVAPELILLVMKNRNQGKGNIPVARGLSFSFELDDLEDVLAHDTDPSEVRIFAGHAGWTAGQLDSEIERHAWHVVRADHATIFLPDDDLWERLIPGLEPPGILI